MRGNGLLGHLLPLKLYATESDSVTFGVHAAGGSTVTSTLTRPELHDALQRKESVGDLGVGIARAALSTYESDVAAGLVIVRPIDPTLFNEFETVVERCYRRVPPIYLRTLDAIHLATAVVAGEAEFVTTDKRLRDAVAAFGLTLFPPP